MSERLKPGDTAPAFTLPDADGNEVSLASHQGRKVIVYFYPAGPHPRLHQAGVRLHRQPRTRWRAPGTT